MGIVPSLVLIAAGAILTWAVTATVNGIDLNAVGIILMIVGGVGLVLSLIFWSSWFGPGYWGHQRTVYTDGARPATRRTTVVDDDPALR